MLQRVFLIAALTIIGLLVALIYALPTPQAESAADTDRTILIRNVRLFDGDTLAEGADILLADGRIAAMGSSLDRPAGAALIDGSGMTALPGMIDAHTHSYGDALSNAIRFGVTSQLDMFTPPDISQPEVASRKGYEPRQRADLFSSSYLATVPNGHGTQFGIPVDTLSSPQEAEAWVARRVEEEADYIKIVYMPYQNWVPSLDRETAAALIDAAHAQGLLAVAHISSLEGARELLEEGVDGFVHIFADRVADQAFIDLAVEREVFIVPTLTVLASALGHGGGNDFATDPAIEPYLSPLQLASMGRGFGRPLPGFDWEIGQENVRLLHEARVPLLAGSDAPNPGTAHGASLLQEAELLTGAGLSAMDALYAVTSNPADAFGFSERGRLVIGGRADLVLVEGRPEEAITDLRRIRHIIKNGSEVIRSQQSQIRVASAGIAEAEFSTFDTDLAATNNYAWQVTADDMMGGVSSAQLAWQAEGADATGGALSVTADVRPGFIMPWGGAALFPDSESAEPVSIGAHDQLVFEFKADQGRYSVMMFDAAMAAIPPSQSFDATGDWQTVALDLADFQGFDRERFVGLAITAGPQIGTYRFAIDSVRLD